MLFVRHLGIGWGTEQHGHQRADRPLSKRSKKTFPLAFKLEFLREWDACVVRGEKARLQRIHGVGTTTVRNWRQARARGEYDNVYAEEIKRDTEGLPVYMGSRERAEMAQLRAENERLKKKLAQSEAVQEILGKAYELLEGITQSSDPELPIPPTLLTPDEYIEFLKRHNLS